MLLPDEKVLAAATEGTAFLALAWEEMFDAYIPDTFQPRLFNLPLLIDELRAVATKAETSPQWHPHVQAIQAELSQTLQWDHSFLDALPYLRWAAGTLVKGCPAKQLIETAKTLQVHQHRYQELAEQTLESAADGLPHAKEAAFRALRRVGTIAINAGFRREDFKDLCDAGAFVRQTGDWMRDLVGMIGSSRSSNRRLYRCTFAINADRRLPRRLARKLGFQIEKATRVAGSLQNLAPEATFIWIEVPANTPSEALQSAARKVRPTLDIFNFYSRSYSLSLCDDALVSDGSAQILLKIGAQSLRKLPARRSAPNLAARAISEIMERLLYGRIFNALEHYTLVQRSAAYRVKLVNLWAAVECLAIGSIGKPVHERVQATVLPIVSWRRIDKITRYIATILTELRSKGSISMLGSGFSTEGVVSAEEVLLVLCKPKDHPDISSLLNAVAANPLLRNRIFNLWKMFSNPTTLLKDTIISRQRTEWHLLRIYRARNLVVHYGEEMPCLPHLLDHLQYYFSLTLSRILDSMSSHHDWTVTDAVAHWTLREEYFRHNLAHSPSTLKVRDFFPRPIRRINECLWP